MSGSLIWITVKKSDFDAFTAVFKKYFDDEYEFVESRDEGDCVVFQDEFGGHGFDCFEKFVKDPACPPFCYDLEEGLESDAVTGIVMDGLHKVVARSIADGSPMLPVDVKNPFGDYDQIAEFMAAIELLNGFEAYLTACKVKGGNDVL